MNLSERKVREETLEVLDHPNVDVSAIENRVLAEKVSRFLSELILFADTANLDVYNPYPKLPEFRYRPILAFQVALATDSNMLCIFVRNWEKTIGIIEVPSQSDFESVDYPSFLKEVQDIFTEKKIEDEKYAAEIEKRRIIDASREARV